MRRRTWLAAAAAAFVPAMPYVARAQSSPGVTDSEIRIGTTAPLSGPASAYGTIGLSQGAAWQWFNDQGGIAGRRVKFLCYDDGYSPPKTVEQVRRLVEQDEVACLCNNLGTAANTAILKYVNQKKVPHLFVGSGADKFQDPAAYPWTIGWQPSYRVEARIFARYLLGVKPNAKIGIFYQNDDFGKDYLIGFRDVLGADFNRVKTVSYEVTDATIDSQVISLQQAGVDAVLSASTAKFAAQFIRKVASLNWQPLQMLSNASNSAAAVIEPAGADKAVGLISNAYYKDPTDIAWKDDPAIAQWRDVMRKYLPGADLKDALNVYGYSVGMTMIAVLRQCGNDLSRENLMRQAATMNRVPIPTLLPGVTINTSPTNYHTIGQVQLMRWDGTRWVLFGDVLSGASA